MDAWTGSKAGSVAILHGTEASGVSIVATWPDSEVSDAGKVDGQATGATGAGNQAA